MAFHGDRYDPTVHPLQAFKLALMGWTDKQIADFFEINVQTLDYWKRTKPRFNRSLKAGKDKADAEVAASWYKKATGFTRMEDHPVSTKAGVVVVKIEKYYPADTAAIKSWMAIRQRALWTEVAKSESIQTNINITKIDLTGFSTEKLKLLEEMGLRKALSENAGEN